MESEKYRKINNPINSSLYSVQNQEYKWGVVDEQENVIIEFGKYAWIDGFQNGLAKVIGYNDNTSPYILGTFTDDWTFVKSADIPKRYEQGIIDENGNEVLALEYNIWKFYGKDFPTIKAFKDGVEHKYYYKELNPKYIDDDDISKTSYDNRYNYNQIKRDSWDAMTDGQYGDMPDEFDGDYSFLGY